MSPLRLQGPNDRYRLPGGWHLSGGLARLHYELSSTRQGPVAVNASCAVTFTLMGHFLLLAATTSSAAVHQLTLSLKQHVQFLGGDHMSIGPSTPAAAMLFPEQQTVWAQVKDRLALPIKTALCKVGGKPLPLSLLLLPSELRDCCLRYLQVALAPLPTLLDLLRLEWQHLMRMYLLLLSLLVLTPTVQVLHSLRRC